MRQKRNVIFQLILGFWKSIIFNFRYFPIKIAIRFPVLIGVGCRLDKMRGKVEIIGPIKTGMILFGVGPTGLFDHRVDKSLFYNGGVLTFRGNARFGPGTRLLNDGTMDIGKNFTVTGATKIICSERVSFGDDVLLSWEILIMDKDYHKMVYEDHESEIKKPIVIGNHVWIGCRSSILKGTVISDDSVVAAMACVNRSFKEKSILIGGIPAKVIKNNITWKR